MPKATLPGGSKKRSQKDNRVSEKPDYPTLADIWRRWPPTCPAGRVRADRRANQLASPLMRAAAGWLGGRPQRSR